MTGTSQIISWHARALFYNKLNTLYYLAAELSSLFLGLNFKRYISCHLSLPINLLPHIQALFSPLLIQKGRFGRKFCTASVIMYFFVLVNTRTVMLYQTLKSIGQLLIFFFSFHAAQTQSPIPFCPTSFLTHILC